MRSSEKPKNQISRFHLDIDDPNQSEFLESIIQDMISLNKSNIRSKKGTRNEKQSPLSVRVDSRPENLLLLEKEAGKPFESTNFKGTLHPEVMVDIYDEDWDNPEVGSKQRNNHLYSSLQQPEDADDEGG